MYISLPLQERHSQRTAILNSDGYYIENFQTFLSLQTPSVSFGRNLGYILRQFVQYDSVVSCAPKRKSLGRSYWCSIKIHALDFSKRQLIVRSSAQLNTGQVVAFATLLYAKPVVIFRIGTLKMVRKLILSQIGSQFEYIDHNQSIQFGILSLLQFWGMSERQEMPRR